jgi:transcriptional regulator with XRE-family HTH domain
MTEAPSDGLGLRLTLVLKALNLSRGQLAVSVGVDKSLVSRWLSGQVVPNSHNLARIGQTLARVKPGFNATLWDKPLPEFEKFLGLAPSGAAPSPLPATPPVGAPPMATGAEPISYPPTLLAAARRETQRRGRSYEGFYELTHPAASRLGTFATGAVMIWQRDGVLRMRWGVGGWEVAGELFLVMGQLFGFLVDTADDTVVLIVLNGVTMPRVELMDGLAVTNAMDGQLTPTAYPLVMARRGTLTADEAGNDAHFESLKAAAQFPLEPDAVTPELRAHLLPDIGPRAVAAGQGELLLRLPAARSWTRGGTNLQ